MISFRHARRSPFTVTLLAAIALPACACFFGACAPGEGDPAPRPNVNVLGNGRKVSSLADPSATPRPATNAVVGITGARVVAIDDYDETRDGKGLNKVYLQDVTRGPTPYQGILALKSLFSPPSLRIAAGDVIDAAGVFQEYAPMGSDPSMTTPELYQATLSSRFDALGAAPQPVVISVDDLVGYTNGRKWLSMLVTVQGVKLAAGVSTRDSGSGADAPDSAGRFYARLTGGSGAVASWPCVSNEMFDVIPLLDGLAAGTAIGRVTGVVTFAFGRSGHAFSIAPRAASDVELNRPLAAVRSHTALATLCVLSACVRLSPQGPVPSTPTPGAPGLDVRAGGARPPIVVVARDGDPVAALAVAVAVEGGPAASAALAAIVEARLMSAKCGIIDSSSDRAGYRMRVLLDQREGAAEHAVRALEDALLTRVVSGSPEAQLAAKRVAALRSEPLEDPALLDLATCSGEPGLSPSETLPDLTTPGGMSQLESWRRAAHGVGRVAFGVVAHEPLARRVADAFRASPPWPEALRADAHAFPEADTTKGFFDASLPAGAARLTAAFWVNDRDVAITAAKALGDPENGLRDRLSALALPFRLHRVVATAKHVGACLLLEADSEPSPAGNVGLENAAGVAAALLRHEVRRIVATRDKDPSVSQRQIRALSDPRDAADAAAWWALSSPQRGEPHSAMSHVVLGVGPSVDAPARASAHEIAPVQRASQPDVAARFSDATARATAAWASPVSESRVSVEAGQGEAWILVASTCASTESASDAGTSALAMIAASLGAGDHEGVQVEPWVSGDGAGVLAHASYARRGESAVALATRVADVAGRAFAATAPTAELVTRARSLSLARLDENGERWREEVGESVWPSRAGAVFPWGLYGPVARASSDSVRYRWAHLGVGPVRVAVLANDSEAQAKAAVDAVDRWLPRTTSPRSCAALPASVPYLSGTHAYPVPARTAVGTGRAFVVAHVASEEGATRPSLDATLAALNGQNGLLARALVGTQVRANAWAAGHGAATLVGVELRGADSALDAGTANVRQVFSALARGELGDAGAAQGYTNEGAIALARLDPRQRLLELWRGETALATEASVSALRRWLAESFRDANVAVISERPRP